jgi:hypothetical protein
MLRVQFQSLVVASFALAVACSANGQTTGSTPAVERQEIYNSPINNSGFRGLVSDEHSVVSLLNSPVAVDLELSDEQIDKLRSIYLPIAQHNIKLMMRLRSPSRLVEGEEQGIRAEQATLASELNESMRRVLNDSQRKRLEEISLQVGGPSTLITEPRALSQLGLSVPQLDKLKTIVADMWIDEARLKEEHRAKLRIQSAEFGLNIQQVRRARHPADYRVTTS